MRGLASLELLDVNGDDKFADDDTQPGGLGKGRAMDVEAQATDLDLDAIFEDVGKAAQGEVADALDGEAGEDSDDGEEDKGGEVEDNEDSEDEGRIEEGHIVGNGSGDALPSASR